jgi:C4-dicarboxylate-binding protein DctP
MKRRVILLMLAALLAQSLDAAAQQINLRAAPQVPKSDVFFGTSLVAFKEEVEKQSGNAISVEIFDSGQPYVDDQILDAVASGAMDIGVAGLSLFANKLPAVGILEQPFLFNFEALVRATASPDSELRRLIDETILASMGVRILWWQSLGNTVFFSKGRDVAQPQRIKEQKVRVFSKTLAELVTRCGGTPSVLSDSKLHAALRDGAVDLAMAGIAALEPSELWKVTDTITRTEHAPIEYFLIINDKVWKSLSPNHQSVIAQAAKTVERQTRERISKIESGACSLARQKGMQVRELTPDQVAEWRACSSELLGDYMDKNAGLADQLMAAYRKLRTDPCCTAPPSTGPFSRR